MLLHVLLADDAGVNQMFRVVAPKGKWV